MFDDDLFDAYGVSISLDLFESYPKTGESIEFAQLFVIVRSISESAIGCHRVAGPKQLALR